MNLKASFSHILALSLLLGLSACANRNTPSDVTALPDLEKSTPQRARDKQVNASTSSKAESPETEQTVANQSIDVLDRIRQGFRFPDLTSKHITQYEKWSTEHDTYLESLFARGTPFLFHIVEEIEKRGLPMELALLPAIESAYKPDAVSRSQAGGLWQFIPSTGRHFGLRQDWWYDGRRDTLASTTAALDYLTQLNTRFDGDWFLTLAAYNAGQGTVARAIKSNEHKGQGTDYQQLSLRLETRRYVPKLIALKNIINNPDAYGVKLPFIESKPYFEVVDLPGQIDLKKFAKDADIELSELRHLNAGFKRWATSPEGPYQLLIPINADGNINHAVAAAQRAVKIDYARHSVVEGDSLSRIARQYGVSVSALQSSNNLPGTTIRAGNNLIIPVRASQAVAASTTSAAVSIANDQAANKRVVHHVRRGDTLWSIARKYKVQVNNLLSWNNISKNQILRLNQAVMVLIN
ncbi:MAG: membrane-bound lytic murein transglycosylase D [Arenicella sp.]|jgi:membrane-bound lytic murein transglycosylase D